MFFAVEFILETVISLASLIYFFEILLTSLDIVAENNIVCLFDEVLSKIKSKSSLNPMLSISSASSRITLLTSSSFRFFLFNKSLVLPGVPTTI